MKYKIIETAATDVIKKVVLLPRVSQIAPAITLANKVQMLSHDV